MEPDEEGDHPGLDLSSLDPACPTPSSRTSLQKVCSIISTFNEFKRRLVVEIGFGGMLRLPAISKLNLKFSTWLMSMVDGPNKCIRLSHDRSISFWPGDIHKVFGIPCGNLDIHSLEFQQTDSSIQFFRSVLGMPDKGNQVLKCVELVIMKELNESTASNLEIDCFKMAFVIFCMGHILTPSSKHDHAIIDYWSAIANTDKITDFNFCDYVFADLLSACWKVKQDIQNNRPVTHLMGCHLFFQIFYLDNLDLGMLNLPHNSYPRIASFDESRIRKMIIQCTKIGPGPPDFSLGQIRHHSQICYMRSVWDSKSDANISSTKKPLIPSKITIVTDSPQPVSAGTSTFLTNIPTPSDFRSILKSNYPQLAHS